MFIQIHRRLLSADGFGLDEPLNEIAYGHGVVARGQHYLIFGAKKSAVPTVEAQERFLQLKKHLAGWIFFSDATNVNFSKWRKAYNNVVCIKCCCKNLLLNLLSFSILVFRAKNFIAEKCKYFNIRAMG